MGCGMGCSTSIDFEWTSADDLCTLSVIVFMDDTGLMITTLDMPSICSVNVSNRTFPGLEARHSGTNKMCYLYCSKICLAGKKNLSLIKHKS